MGLTTRNQRGEFPLESSGTYPIRISAAAQALFWHWMDPTRTPAGADPKEPPMPVRFRMTGCWMSIILSLFLTLLLNLLIRGCNTF